MKCLKSHTAGRSWESDWHKHRVAPTAFPYHPSSRNCTPRKDSITSLYTSEKVFSFHHALVHQYNSTDFSRQEQVADVPYRRRDRHTPWFVQSLPNGPTKRYKAICSKGSPKRYSETSVRVCQTPIAVLSAPAMYRLKTGNLFLPALHTSEEYSLWSINSDQGYLLE